MAKILWIMVTIMFLSFTEENILGHEIDATGSEPTGGHITRKGSDKPNSKTPCRGGKCHGKKCRRRKDSAAASNAEDYQKDLDGLQLTHAAILRLSDAVILVKTEEFKITKQEAKNLIELSKDPHVGQSFEFEMRIFEVAAFDGQWVEGRIEVTGEIITCQKSKKVMVVGKSTENEPSLGPRVRALAEELEKRNE